MYLASVAVYTPVCIRVGYLGLTSGDYSHVFVMPVIAILVYLFSKPAPREVPDRHFMCMVLWLSGITFAYLGLKLNNELLVKFTFPVTVLGAVGGLFGWREALRFRLPVFLVVFAVGLPTDLMRLAFSKVFSFVSAGVVHDAANSFLPSAGPYILRGGTVFTRTLIFNVARSCGGTRWLVAFFVLGTLVAWRRRLSFRENVRFVAVLIAVAAFASVARICLTFLTAVLVAGRHSLGGVHTLWSVVITVICVLALPFLGNRVGKWRFYPSAVRVYVMLVIVGFGLTMFLKAREGSRLGIRLDKEKQVAHVAVKDGLPKAMHGFLRPDAQGPRRFAGLLCCGFVHTGTVHFLAEVGVLILIGAALRQVTGGRWWPAFPLIAGQLVGALASWMLLAPRIESAVGTSAVVAGSSGAVSGLFGAFLVSLIRARKDRRLALVYGGVYAVCLVLETLTRSPSYFFSTTSHLLAVAAGVLCTLVVGKVARPEPHTGL